MSLPLAFEFVLAMSDDGLHWRDGYHELGCGEIIDRIQRGSTPALGSALLAVNRLDTCGWLVGDEVHASIEEGFTFSGFGFSLESAHFLMASTP